MYHHEPVLLEEVLKFLEPQGDRNFVDGTLGGGGYTKALLQETKGKVLSIDLDADALTHVRSQAFYGKERWIGVQGNFRDVDSIVTHHAFGPVHGIVVDLGLSSYELDASGRGISFQKDEPLDMRFDVREDETAADMLQLKTVQELEALFRDYGEEKYAHRIAEHIGVQRQSNPIRTTQELVRVVTEALPKAVQWKAQDSLRRVFQALRIAVNHELQNLETFLPKALDILAPGGRLAVVSFHSLEDRIVKQFFLDAARGCVCPPEFPICQCGRDPKARILTKKVVTAGKTELERNSRSKPAKLRVLEKM